MLSHHFTFINGIFQTCEQILPFFNLLCCLSSVCIIHAHESHQPKEDKERRLKRQKLCRVLDENWRKRGIPKATQALQKGKYQETMKEMLKSLYCRVEIIQKSATCSNLLRLKRQNCFINCKSIKRVKTLISVLLCCWQNGFKPQKKCSVSSLLFKKPRSHLGISALFLPEDFSAPQ